MATAITVARCPDCKQRIEIRPFLRVGDALVCPHCEADLEVVDLNPVELDWAYIPPADEDEEWDDWDDEQDDKDD